MENTKVCLINPRYDQPPSTEVYSKYNQPVHNLGLAYLSSVLESNKFNVDVFECQPAGIDHHALIDSIKNNHYRIIGISVNFFNFKNTSQLLIMLKNTKIASYITVGGILASMYPERLLNIFDNIKCCMIGEGELTIVDLYKTLADNKKLEDVEGIAYKEHGKIILTKERSELPVLDQLPFPSVNYLSPEKMVMLMIGRGCLGNCSFCAAHYYYDKIYRQHPGYRYTQYRYTIEYIESLIKKYDIEYINFADDNFFAVSYDWMNGFIEGMKSLSKKIKFYINACAKDVIKFEEYLLRLKECGLEVVFIGLESFVQRQLRTYRKAVTVDQNIKAINILYKNNIKCNAGLMLLDPFVTLEEVRENLEILLKTRYCDISYESAPPVSLISCVHLIQNTDLYNWVEKENLLDHSEKGYKFADLRVNKYYSYCLKWQRNIEECFFVRRILYIYRKSDRFFRCLNAKRIELMKIDIAFLLDLSKWIMEDAEDIEQCMKEYDNRLILWKQEVENILTNENYFQRE